MNPLRVDSTLDLNIKGDYFGFTESMSVSTNSRNMHQTEMTATFLKNEGTLKLKNFNQTPLKKDEMIEFSFGPFTIPSDDSIKAFAQYTYTFFDPEMQKVEQVVNAIIINSFDPDPEKPDDGISMVMLGIYISAALVTTILVLCIVMII